jgi:hypothetical protein
MQSREGLLTEGFTKTEADDLVSRTFETRVLLPGVPLHARGCVIEAIDAGDHWNVLIQWDLRGRPVQQWYNKFELKNYMQLLGAAPRRMTFIRRIRTSRAKEFHGFQKSSPFTRSVSARQARQLG